MTQTTIFQELASTVGKQKGEEAMNLSDTAVRSVIQTELGFTSRTRNNILVLPLSKIFLAKCGYFISLFNWALLSQALNIVILSSPGDYGFID